MALANMMAVDRDALICDMAETYQIYDISRVPVPLLGTLAVGLRDDSRIKMKINGVKAGPETMLVANLVDLVQWLVWSKTKDGEHGRNKPKSVAKKLYEREHIDHSRDLTPSQYEEIRNRILKGNNNG